MTRQEVFDIVAIHLIKQSKKSRIGSGCAYRGKGGLKCAIGVLIKDEFYNESWNDESICPEVVRALKKSGVLPMELTDDDRIRSDLEFLEGLQIIHDFTPPLRSDLEFLEGLQIIHDFTPPHSWMAPLLSFAVVNGLNGTAAIRAQKQLEQAIR